MTGKVGEEMEGGESHGQITEPGVSIRDTLTSYMRDLPITNQT